VLMSVMALVFSGEAACVEGYTADQLLDAIVKLRKFRAGSCKARILIPISSRELLLMRSC
jgi:hypothetical protein